MRVLSPFVGKFSGSIFSLQRLKKDYPLLVCAFETDRVPNDPATHTSCTNHAPEWINAVQSGAPQTLFVDQYEFDDNCTL